ncbi:MAG: hypothetical protein WDN48_17030 [Pseudolabrys sp.]
MNYFYRISGLTVSSEIPLPGAYPVEQGDACDVTMRPGRRTRAFGQSNHHQAALEVAGDLFLLRAPGAGRFLLRGGRDIAFEVEAGVQPADCAAYLIGRVFGTLLHQRGHIVLHASAVEVGGKAVLFCGRSGVGKSTLAAFFCGAVNPLSATTSAPSASTTAVPSCLSGFAPAQIDGGGHRGARSRPPPRREGSATDRQYFVEPSVNTARAKIPLGAIYVLGFEQPADPALVDTLSAPEMLHAVRSNAYRPALVKQTGQAQRYFEAAALIAGRIPVCRLTRGSGLGELPELADRVERH